MTLRASGCLLLATASLAGPSVLACGPSIDDPPTRVFVAPAWAADERMTYNLVERDGRIAGTCELETKLDFEPGMSQLSFHCNDAHGNRDDRTAVAESGTLQPISSLRVIVDAADNRRTTFASTYGEGVVELTAEVDGKKRSAARDLPKASPGGPDPGYYDDESLLWLVRGIPLFDGFRGVYIDVNAGTGRTFPVEVSVHGQEPVRVPAGSFAAWKVRIRTSTITHYFWIESAVPHRVVRAHVEHLVYELTAAAP